MPEQSNDYRIAVFGAGGVGKSSIVLRFHFIKKDYSSFDSRGLVTIKFHPCRQVIGCNKSNVCTLHITDTTGSHQFPAMQRLSISKGHAFLLVYSITSKQSLEELGPIYEMILEVKNGQESPMSDVPIVLVGNKMDEDSHRQVSRDVGQQVAKKWNCLHLETSAKMNQNIDELFEKLFSLEKQRNLTISLISSSGGGCDGNDKNSLNSKKRAKNICRIS
uniref:GTP-binding protein Di-Ras2 n=1 Tax=Romanomermis culicivorax TaxID=13658 RepID=A0A915JWA8_ROMCU